MRVAIEARMRQYGLLKHETLDQRAETFIGRLSLAFDRGERAYALSPEQYRAAQDYAADYNAYQRALYSRPEYQERTQGDGGEAAYEAFCKQSIARFIERREIVRDFMIAQRSPNASEFLRLCVVDGRAIPRLVPDGREILNVFIVHYEQGEKKESSKAKAA